MADYTKLPSRDHVLAHRQERLENGFIFPLTITSLGMDETINARIRRIATIDRAVLEGLPTNLQDVIFEGINEFQKEQKAAEGMDDPRNLTEMMGNNDKIMNAADAWCKAAFIHPRLVDTRAEIADEDTWLVEDVEPEDRAAVLMLCLDSDSAQLKKLKMFRPSRATAVQNNAPVSLTEASERRVATEQGGV